MSHARRRVLLSRLAVLLFGVLLLGLVAAGCGSSGSSSSSETTAAAGEEEVTTSEETASSGEEEEGGEGGTETSSYEAPAGVPSMEELYKGTETDPPSSSPPVAKGKSVWWISCGQSIPDCSEPAEAAEEAAKKMGLEFHIADGKLNEGGGYEKAVRTALAAGADAMILHGSVSCSTAKAALEEAKKAGVILLGVESLDCSDVNPEEEGVYSAPLLYSKKKPTIVDYLNNWGEQIAAYLIDATEGKADALLLAGGGEPVYEYNTEGFKKMMEKCSECEITEEVSFLPPDLTPEGALTQRIRTSLLKASPDLNSVDFPFDVTINSVGGAKLVEESGRELVTAGGSGSSDTLDLVREGKWEAVPSAHSVDWIGWGAIDEINRLLNGEKPVPEGIGQRLVTKEQNLPANPGENFESPIDWKAIYEKSWEKANG